MRELLDKLLVYNRSQMGLGFEVDRANVDLAQACRDEIEQLQASIPGARIRLHGPDAVHGMFDARAMREVLANLVVNAHKYGDSGGEIRVELRDGNSAVELSISNEGDTIPPEALDLMFEPLRRGGVSGGDLEHASLGLGLFIVSQIVKAHDGTIRAESAADTTTFRMHLPRA
ncbi:sensor histidine kinase [Luteimonas sp. A649]